MNLNNISKQLNFINEKIVKAAVQSDRSPCDVQLLAVSKIKPVALILEAFQAGQRHFGENYVQESIDKIKEINENALFDEKITWYFIGSLQSNKTRVVAEHFDWVQSVERLKIAERLNYQRPENLPPLNVCIQVNISLEESKSGATLAQVVELASQIDKLPRLKLRGIMAIPQKTKDPIVLEKSFNDLFNIYNELKETYPSVDTLSMGMSGDLETAIRCGSTMVRIGTDIFGARE